MIDKELKELAKIECAKLLKSEKGYNGLSFQEFWAEGFKDGAEFGYNKCGEQLIKAKEIIKDLLQVLPKENIEGVYDVTEAAEKFLREVEE